MPYGNVEGWGGVDPWGGNLDRTIAEAQAQIGAMESAYGGGGGMITDPNDPRAQYNPGDVFAAGFNANNSFNDWAANGGVGGGFLNSVLFDQTPITAQVPDLLTDLSKVTPDLFAQGLLGPSMSFSPSIGMAAAPAMSLPSLSPAVSDLVDEVDRSTSKVNEKDARTVAGIAMAENRGMGGLGMQSVMNAGMNRAATDWGGLGTSLPGQMTAPGQFAAPYSGPIDPNTLDMARQALAGTLPDLTDGARSFRADRPSANDAAHRSLEALGSQSLYGHVFSDYAPPAPTPPERPAEFGRNFADLYSGSTQDPMIGGPGGSIVNGLLADAPPTVDVASAPTPAAAASWYDGFAPAMESAMGAVRGMGNSIAGAFAAGLGPRNSIYDRVQEYTEPSGIRSPREYTDRLPSFEQPGPTPDQRMAAARAGLAARMEQRTRDVVAGGYSFPYGEQRPSLQAFMDSPAMTAWNQPSTAFAQAPAPAPSPAQQSWGGSFLSGLGPSGAMAATPAPGPYGFSGLSPATGKGMQEVLSNWGGQYASTPPTPAATDFVAMGPTSLPAPVDVPTLAQPASYTPTSVPTPPERPTDIAPAAAAPRSASSSVPTPPERPTDIAPAAAAPRSASSSVPMPPERPADLVAPQAPSTGITMGDVAKYGLPVVGGLAGGPAGALAGMALYQGGSWLAGKIPDGTFGTPGGEPISDPYAYGPNGDYPAVQQAVYGGAQQGAGAAPAPAPVRTPVRAIHMPARNAWLSV